jgi:hypothetical protein
MPTDLRDVGKVVEATRRKPVWNLKSLQFRAVRQARIG